MDHRIGIAFILPVFFVLDKPPTTAYLVSSWGFSFFVFYSGKLKQDENTTSMKLCAAKSGDPRTINDPQVLQLKRGLSKSSTASMLVGTRSLINGLVN